MSSLRGSLDEFKYSEAQFVGGQVTERLVKLAPRLPADPLVMLAAANNVCRPLSGCAEFQTHSSDTLSHTELLLKQQFSLNTKRTTGSDMTDETGQVSFPQRVLLVFY